MEVFLKRVLHNYKFMNHQCIGGATCPVGGQHRRLEVKERLRYGIAVKVDL